MCTLLRGVLQTRPGIFIDVGVNLGQTLIKVKCLDPARRYLGFEPNPACVCYLRQLVRANRYPDVQIFPLALFNRDCVLSLDFFSVDDADSSASLIPEFRASQPITGREYVPAFRFESLSTVLSIKQIAVIKIDVEGAELEVIETLQDAIRAFRPIILLEVLPVYSTNNEFRHERQQNIEAVFRSLEYKWFRIEKTDEEDYSGLKEISTIGIHGELRDCDYLLGPAEALPDLIALSRSRLARH